MFPRKLQSHTVLSLRPLLRLRCSSSCIRIFPFKCLAIASTLHLSCIPYTQTSTHLPPLTLLRPASSPPILLLRPLTSPSERPPHNDRPNKPFHKKRHQNPPARATNRTPLTQLTMHVILRVLSRQITDPGLEIEVPNIVVAAGDIATLAGPVCGVEGGGLGVRQEGAEKGREREESR